MARTRMQGVGAAQVYGAALLLGAVAAAVGAYRAGFRAGTYKLK